jgi:hypothetical protein
MPGGRGSELRAQPYRVRYRDCRCLGMAVWPAVLAMALAAGCGGAQSSRLPTAQVTGHVTYRGQPLSHGLVRFIPMQAGEGIRVAYGIVDERGRYRLSTYGQDDGAPLGKYRVTIESRKESSPEASVAKRMTPQGLVPAQQMRSLIPERYLQADKSGLTATVEAGGNTFNFDLAE